MSMEARDRYPVGPQRPGRPTQPPDDAAESLAECEEPWSVRRQLALLRQRYQEQRRLSRSLEAQLDTARQTQAVLQAEKSQLYQDHLILHDILRSRGWRVLSRVSNLKRQLSTLKERLHRLLKQGPPRPDSTLPAPPLASAVEAASSVGCGAVNPGRLERLGGPRFPSERKFRVIFILRPGVYDAAAVRYRGYNVIEALQFAGIEATHFDEELLPQGLGRVLTYDLIVLVRRPLTAKIALLLDAAHQAGVPVLFDIDDYVFEEQIIPYVEWYRQQPPEVARDCVQTWRRCLNRCRYVTVSTPFLVDRAAALGKQVYLIRNGLNSVQLEQSRRVLDHKRPTGDGLLRLGYFSGTRTHQADFRLIAPVLVQLLDEFPHVSLVVAGDFDMGDFPEVTRFADRLETPPFVDWRALPAAIGRVDINLIPLDINPFNEGKSDLKYYEAGLLQVPSVASPTHILARSIRHGVNGLLARTPEQWYQAIRSLVVDAGLRQRLGRNAYEHVLGNYVPEVIARQAVAAYRDVLQHHRRRLGVAEDALSFTILVSDLDQAAADRSPVSALAEELVRLGGGVTLWLPPGGRISTASQADQVIGEHFFEPLFAIQVGGDIPCGDVLLATDARTAHLAKAVEHRAWRVAYLIPEYEPAHLPAGAEFRQAQASYQLGLYQLALDEVLAEFVSRRHGGAVAVLPAWAEPRAESAPNWTATRKLLVHVSSTLPMPLWERAVEALCRVHHLHPSVEILLCGSTVRRQIGIPVPHRNLGTPSMTELEALYAEAPVCVLLHATSSPRWLYDLMAAGCPVVTATGNLETTPRAFDPGRGMLSVALETDSLIQALDAILVNPVLQTALAQNAVAHTRRMPRAAAAARMLWKLVSGPSLAEDGGAVGQVG